MTKFNQRPGQRYHTGMAKAPSAEDLAEIASGKGSARDKAEARSGRRIKVGTTRKALRRGRGGHTKRRKVRV